MVRCWLGAWLPHDVSVVAHSIVPMRGDDNPLLRTAFVWWYRAFAQVLNTAMPNVSFACFAYLRFSTFLWGVFLREIVDMISAEMRFV